MKIAFINNSVETFTPTQSGAIATHIWECCKAAQRSGVEPLVISIRCGAKAYSTVKTVMLDYPTLANRRALTYVWRAQRKLTGWRHLRQGNYANRVVKALREARMEDGVLILHNDPEIAVVLRKKFPNAFIVHHFHNLLECNARFRSRFRESVDAVTAVSDFTSRWIETYYNCENVTTIYNGVDSDRFVPLSRAQGVAPVINFTGRTGIEKAPDLLLRACFRLTERTRLFSLQLLGSNHWQKFEMDQYQETLRDLSEELEEKGIVVRRPGHIDRESLPARLQEADIHVVPSRWDEPFGLVTAEGMACGLATVASRTGGTPELIGNAGLLFERDSVEELANHLYALVTDRDLRLELGLKACARAKEFTWIRTWEGFRRLKA